MQNFQVMSIVIYIVLCWPIHSYRLQFQLNTGFYLRLYHLYYVLFTFSPSYYDCLLELEVFYSVFKSTSDPHQLCCLCLPCQTLKRKEKEYEHEMERLAREKIATQQRLAELKNELSQCMDVIEIDRVLRQTIQPEDDQASTSTASGTGMRSNNITYYLHTWYRTDTYTKLIPRSETADQLFFFYSRGARGE